MYKIIVGLVAAGILFANATTASAAPGTHHHRHAQVKHLPVGAVHIVIAGVKYWLADGVYYRKADNRYVVVKSPVGAKVKYLPNGAVVVKRGGKQYFHHAGIYYRWLPAVREYEVVKLEKVPVAKAYRLGSVLETLPNGANATLVNGVQYFTLNKQYFMRSERSGKTVYVVVDINAG